MGILSGCYLLGSLFVSQLDASTFWIQFLNVHLLLFGGATAFNSYWDKDEGPIGGLKNPPPLSDWMRNASIILQCVGLIFAATVSLQFAMVYAASMLLFWLYSSPLARWKSHPHLSLIAIGGSTGLGGFLLGYIAGGAMISWQIVIPGLGASLILLSLYPVSQIFQMDEDRIRGDQTFAVSYGLQGVIRFFMIAFISGILILSIALRWVDPVIAGFFLSISGLSGMVIWLYMKQLRGTASEYAMVMKIKYVSSVMFIAFIMICYFQIHYLDARRVLDISPQRIVLNDHYINLTHF